MAGSVWRSIRDHDHINVRVHPLPADTGGGVLVRYPDGTVWIVLDKNRPPEERRAILCHELEHLARGTVRQDGVPASVIEREERAVHRAVARRLVPPAQLQDLIRRLLELEEPVTLNEVCEEFDVPPSVAYEACRQAG